MYLRNENFTVFLLCNKNGKQKVASKFLQVQKITNDSQRDVKSSLEKIDIKRKLTQTRNHLTANCSDCLFDNDNVLSAYAAITANVVNKCFTWFVTKRLLLWSNNVRETTNL